MPSRLPRRAPKGITRGTTTSRWRLVLGAALATALLGAALGSWWRARQEGRGQPGLSVLLATVDTLRADALGAYGNKDALTPWMDRLAASGVLFEEAHAHNVVTLPSHANILSGRYALEHGVRDNQGFRFPGTVDTLATLLQARGYRTGAFVSGFPLAARFGLDRGFDVYEDSFVGARARPAFFEQERPGPETVALALRWLDAAAGRPSFCWVHVFEPHYPYEPPEPFASRFPGRPYLGEVAAADAALAPLLEPVLAAGAEGRTLVVLTADHGESLGEHGEATHGIFAYEATLRVPLVLYQPRLFAPRRVSEPVRHVDLLPTILDALAMPVPEGLPGRSLIAVAAGTPAGATTSYFEALSGRLNRGWAPLHGVIQDRTKYVDLPMPEIYDLGSDPHELQDLAGRAGRRVDELKAVLASLRSAERPIDRRKESLETRERLRALGYVGGGTGPTKERYTEDDDPKRLIALDAILQEVVGLYLAGNLPAALARCRELVRLRPQMPVSLLELAHLERESGDLGAAVAALAQALALNPEDTVTAALLGGYLTQGGKARAAVDLLDPYSRRADPDVEVLTTLGLALASAGRSEEALAALARAREMEPRNAMILVDVGTVRLVAGHKQQAREAFDAALAVNPGVARAHSSLGFLDAQDGRTEQALEHWRKALALDPREREALLALGELLRRRGRTAEARIYLEQFVASAPAGTTAPDVQRVRQWLAGSGPPGRRPPGPASRE
jgi:arylsulfatase A-like enzyme/Flp pilus assembly protein TadD